MIFFHRVILFLVTFFVVQNLNGQNKHLFDYADGLSNSLINDICQDRSGFMWLATENGLNRFDGIKFTNFGEENGLSANFITSILERQNGELWIGHFRGIHIYNRETESFRELNFYVADTAVHPYVSKMYECKNGDVWVATSGFGVFCVPNNVGRPRYSTRLNNKFCSLFMQSICEDDEGRIWFGSYGDGLNIYDPVSDQVKTYSTVTTEPYRILHDDITSICKDNRGNMYWGSRNGSLFAHKKDTDRIVQIKSADPAEALLPIKSLLFDSKNQLWVGTDGFGLRKLNPETQLLERFSPPSSPFDFSKSKIHTITEDNTGNLWLGIFQKGLYLLPQKKEVFEHYGYESFGDKSIGSSCVTSIMSDNEYLWLGTDGDGLYSISHAGKNVTHINLRTKTSPVGGNNAMSLLDDGDRIWIGTFFNGLMAYDKKSGKLRSFRNAPNQEANNNITLVKKGSGDELILGSFGQSISRFNTRTEEFLPGLDVPSFINEMLTKWVNDFCFDKNGKLWVGTYNGIIQVDLQEKSAKIFTEGQSQLPSNVIYCIRPDRDGQLWLGTYAGLVKLDPETYTFTTYNEKNGLNNNVVCAIQEDEYQQLWVSTHNGLSRFDRENETFTNYFASDGLQSNEFYRNSSFKTSDNRLFFGGINGLTEIKRNYRNFSRNKPTIMLTDFTRLSQPVKIGEKSGNLTILNKSILLADTIHLQESDNVFAVGFTSKELAKQSRITYEYKMEGFDLDWHKSRAGNRRATYTNLKHGTYTFCVRGRDKTQYSDIRKLQIIIHPPWYKTFWATLLWLLLIVLIVWGIIRLNYESIKRQEAEKVNEKKMQFFINISHEIRTPLTLILDPLDKLLSRKPDSETLRIYQTMQHNANRLFRLINQLLDVRKIDKGQMLTKFQRTNLPQFMKEIARSYELLAADKKIDFRIETSSEDIQAWIDPLNFEKVILNLLSNAFKFTASEGEVLLKISEQKAENKQQIKIVVSDNGIGIPKSDLERVFERFYQVNAGGKNGTAGTGIGLHLSRSLVEQHKGKLFAENRTDTQGTNFVILLPSGHAHLPKEDLLTEETTLPVPTQSSVIAPYRSPSMEHRKQPKSKPKIMVVEDEEEIRNYLHSELSQLYKTVAYPNGKAAFEHLSKDKPDLIISDIMMPEMDGITLCKRVKNNRETSHIPVILLTALSREEDRAEGIETGADLYLVKPFNSDFLKRNISNIFETRKRLLDKIEEKEEYVVEVPETESRDEMLMHKVMTIIKENLSDNTLNVEMLAEQVGISRVHLHRKLKELTNQTTRDFIKSIRMKQAAYLLIHKDMNVNEVAYAVGFSNPSHFSTTFKGYYGISPTEYAAQERESD